ncbi:B12-binding domain-containing radical SAM protein [Salinarimonas sp.]|uniref:B12-binding domain-containing radical SAM protein n=1 Tax=Salinarimonas sp. TaxID=2766526 RepID=UPI00391A08AC
MPSIVRSEIARTEAVEAGVWRVLANGPRLFQVMAHPRVFLAALYHPENFPLPRFSLAISDLARAARKAGASRVFLRDMQLGVSVEEIAADIERIRPDIVGISATFGQQDVLERLVAVIPRDLLTRSRVVFGGSLSALNRDVLLERFPSACVATGAGEDTIAGLIQEARGAASLEEIPGLAFRTAAGEIVQTVRRGPRETDDMLPELDLLDDTFAHRGVVQLETSRGCSYACSFCPRTHKGIWSGDDPKALDVVTPDILRLMQRHPHLARRVFLVDEEFVGYRADGESERRVLGVARALARNGMTFETNSRIDQVYRPHKDAAWHLDRIEMWRELVRLGLDRCLFGIESGVDAVLKRFNKKTTSNQNSIGIRMLSLVGVPPRYTYITFDPLMTREDLRRTCAYQARTDLVLPTRRDLSAKDVFDIATDDISSQGLNGTPFYEHISYMLVSIERLRDAPYTEVARRGGLLGAFNPNMGRYDSAYLDPDLGLLSDCAQRWIDRSFSLDYTLKSIEKYTDSNAKEAVRRIRVSVKRYAFQLLCAFADLVDTGDGEPVVVPAAPDWLPSDGGVRTSFANGSGRDRRQIVFEMMDRHFTSMAETISHEFKTVSGNLEPAEQTRIDHELDRWASRKGWELINSLS